MNANAAAQLRPELHAVVEESMGADKSFIADRLMPMYPVSTQVGEYMKIKRGGGQLMMNPGTTGVTDPLKRAPGTEYKEVTRTTAKDSYKTEDRGLQERIDDRHAQDTRRFFDIQASTSQWLMRNIRIAREMRVQALIQSESTFGDPLEAAVEFSEDNVETMDFPKEFLRMKRLMKQRGEWMNPVLVMSEVIWDLITLSKKMQNYVLGTQVGQVMLTPELVAAKFRIAELVIGASSYDTSKPNEEATDESLRWIWNDEMISLLNVVGGPPEAGGVGRTFVLDELTNGQLYAVESWYKTEIRSTFIRIRQDDDTKIVNENYGGPHSPAKIVGN